VAILLAPLFLLGCSLWLGVATPQPLREAWTAAAIALFPTP
jgi:hydrogenase-4 component F